MIAAQRSSARYFQRPDAEHLEVDSAANSLAGYSARLDVGKRAGTWQGGVALSTISPSYEINDLGFQTSADRVSLDSNLSYEQTQPGPIFRRWNVRGGPDATWNYGGDLVGAGIGANVSGQLTSYWSGFLRFGHQFRSFNDRLTRGGPLAQDPAGTSLTAFASSDFRKAYTLNAFGNLGWDEAGARRASINLGVGLKPASNWDVRVGPNISRSRSVAQYVTTVTDTLAIRTFGRRYIFADLEQTTFGLETRVNVTFTPALTLEMYAQPFLSSGDYEGLKELHAPRTFQFDRYGSELGTVARDSHGTYTVDPDGSGPARTFQVSDRDFTFRSLRGNAVLRWEWRPGSTLFLVWQQSRSESLTALSSDSAYGRVGNFDLNRDARELFGLNPDNIFVIKVNYWLNP